MGVQVFTLNWTIDHQNQGKLLRDFLKENEISKTALTDIKFKGGGLFVNDAPVTVRYSLRAGDNVTVLFPPEHHSEGMGPENIPLAIVYEDDYILIVDKPPYMSTIPSREHPGGSLANAVLHYYAVNGLQSTIHIVNRLDRDTSGLLIIAKHRHVHHLFSMQQRQREIKRTYEAFAQGTIKVEQGTIDAPIGRKADSIIERTVCEGGQPAVTHFQVMGRHQGYTHVSLHLETGRTHQIRVHLAYLGHPLLGDDLYGGTRELISRQALHSCELRFWHPFLKKEMVFHSDLPEDMARLLEEPK